MADLLARVDNGLFWGLVIGFFAGGLAAWRFARLLERFRDAVRHAVHHWQRATEFVRFARDNVGGMLIAGVSLLAGVAGIGLLVYLRVTA